MKLRITNWWKHALVGSLVGLAGAGIQWLVNLIPDTQFYVGWFIVLTVMIGGIVFEQNQFRNINIDRLKRFLIPISAIEYLKLKWLDCIVDVLAAVICCALVLLIFGCL